MGLTTLYQVTLVVTQMVKNLPANTGDMGSIPVSPGVEDPLEGKMATHSSILAWEIHGQRKLFHGITKSWTQLATNIIVYIRQNRL